METLNTDVCPKLYDVVVAVERAPLPSLEVRRMTDGAPRNYDPPPPSLGMSHTAYHLWGRGWTSSNEPLDLEFSSLGSGPLADLFEVAEAKMSECGAADPRRGDSQGTPRSTLR